MTCAGCADCAMEAADRQSQQMPYEIHVTVGAVEAERFRAVCHDIGVKPILIATPSGDGEERDMMTSSTVKGGDDAALDEMNRIALALDNAGLKVLRRKVETAWWHPEAPTEENGRQLGASQYFECHLAIEVLPSEVRWLRTIASTLGAHLSRNAFKVGAAGEVRMATLRAHSGTSREFRERVSKTREAFVAAGFVPEREIVEFAWFDDHLAHDAPWMAANDDVAAVTAA